MMLIKFKKIIFLLLEVLPSNSPVGKTFLKWGKTFIYRRKKWMV